MRTAGLAALAALVPLCAPLCAAADGGVTISGAWTPAADRGQDVALSMTIDNAGEPDVLIRTRCEAANFAEPHTVDHGEGFPSMREIKAIVIPGHATTALGADGPHIMLLQTNRALTAGTAFTCTVGFRDAGRQTIEVKVGEMKLGAAE